MESSEQHKSIGKSLLTGILVTSFILVLKFGAERTTLYQELQGAVYSWLQSRLSAPHRRDELPVVILDISDLEYWTREVQGEKFLVTKREPLMSLIAAVAAQKPKAIGVDIDFSPRKFGWSDPNDSTHLQKLLELQGQGDERVPVFLGIHRSRNKNHESWLGHPRFESLAATIDNPEDYRKMFAWTGDPEGRQGVSLSKALAEAVSHSEQPRPWFFSRVVSQFSQGQTDQGLKAEEFLVNFSPLEELADNRLKTINPLVVVDQGWIFRNKAVLIGDASVYQGRDTVVVPLPRKNRQVPGIYLHAAAVYTLIKAPLYELTPVARLLADLLLALTVLGSVLAIRVYFEKRRQKVAETRTTYSAILVVTLVVVVFGVVFVHKTRVLWDDIAFVLIGLWIHPVVDNSLGGLLGWIRSRLPTALRRLLTEGDS